MTTLFILARHGRHDGFGERLLGRSPGVPLDEEGRAQALRLAERIRWLNPAAVVSSPRERTRETAELAADVLGLEVEIDGSFDEIDFGPWAGKSFAELEADPLWRRWNEERESARAPGGETMGEAQARALGGLTRLARRFAERAVLVVSHADVIKAMMLAELRQPLGGCHRFDVTPGGFMVLVRENLDEPATASRHERAAR